MKYWHGYKRSKRTEHTHTHTHTYKGRNRRESKSSPYVTSWTYRRRYVVWSLRSSGLLRNLGWWIVTDGSGQPTGPIFTPWKLSRWAA